MPNRLAVAGFTAIFLVSLLVGLITRVPEDRVSERLRQWVPAGLSWDSLSIQGTRLLLGDVRWKDQRLATQIGLSPSWLGLVSGSREGSFEIQLPFARFEGEITETGAGLGVVVKGEVHDPGRGLAELMGTSALDGLQGAVVLDLDAVLDPVSRIVSEGQVNIRSDDLRNHGIRLSPLRAEGAIKANALNLKVIGEGELNIEGVVSLGLHPDRPLDSPLSGRLVVKAGPDLDANARNLLMPGGRPVVIQTLGRLGRPQWKLSDR